MPPERFVLPGNEQRRPRPLVLLALAAALLLLVAWTSADDSGSSSVQVMMPTPLPASESAERAVDWSDHAALTHLNVTDSLESAGWPDDVVAKAAAVAGCESGWLPGALGSLGETGLFQIHPVHSWRFTANYGEDAEPLDPVQNATVALEIWQEDGWQPWSCGHASP